MCTETTKALSKGKIPPISLWEISQLTQSAAKALAPDQDTNLRLENVVSLVNQIQAITTKSPNSKSTWKQTLLKVGLIMLGVAAIAASIALAIGTYGAATPLSVIGFKLGIAALGTAGVIGAKAIIGAN